MSAPSFSSFPPTFSSFPDLDVTQGEHSEEASPQSKNKQLERKRKKEHRHRKREHQVGDGKKTDRRSEDNRSRSEHKKEDQSRERRHTDEYLKELEDARREKVEDDFRDMSRPLFYTDRKGDLLNVKYGRLHAGDIPKYNLAGRKCMLIVNSGNIVTEIQMEEKFLGLEMHLKYFIEAVKASKWDLQGLGARYARTICLNASLMGDRRYQL
jgi:hypothetical protein